MIKKNKKYKVNTGNDSNPMPLNIFQILFYEGTLEQLAKGSYYVHSTNKN